MAAIYPAIAWLATLLSPSGTCKTQYFNLLIFEYYGAAVLHLCIFAFLHFTALPYCIFAFFNFTALPY